jgi:hypothetical protein
LSKSSRLTLRIAKVLSPLRDVDQCIAHEHPDDPHGGYSVHSGTTQILATLPSAISKVTPG